MLLDAIHRVQTGDTSSFGEIYDLTYDRIYRSIFYRVLDTPRTEDIISLVYIKSLKSIKNFRGNSEGEFFSWMLRIAYHTLLDDVRSHHEHLSLDQEDEDGETQSIDPGYEVAYSGDLHDRDTLRAVQEYIQTLSPRDQSILTLRIWDDLSYEEIASITGESVSNAKKIVSRSLEKIAANVSYCFIFSLLLHYVY